MITTKKLLLLFWGIIIGIVFINSCDGYLDTPVSGSLDEEALNNKKGVNSLLIGAYGALTGPHSSVGQDAASNWIYGSVAAGEAHKGSNVSDQPPINSFMDMSVNASNGSLNTVWKSRFDGVTRANSVLKVLSQNKDLGETKKKEIQSEALFLRGHFYFELKKLFNNVPWIDEDTQDFNQPNRGPNAVDIWKKIEDDFQFAYENLPETQSDPARANKWAAASYLAKAYIYQGKWKEAKTLLNKIINNGVTSSGEFYGLQDYYGYNFRADHENSSEAVFSIQFVGEDGTGSSYNARRGDRLNFPYGGKYNWCCGFLQPTQDLVNSFRTNKNGLPYVKNYNQHQVKNDMGIASNEPFTPDQGYLDPRLDYTVGRRGIPYKDWGPHPGMKWIRDQKYAGPYSPIKNVYRMENRDKYSAPFSYGSGSAVNYDVIRFDEVLLWAAEAEAETGNLNQSRKYVNRVRERVADDTYGEGWTTYIQNEPSAIATVGSEAAMTSLNASQGDWVIRTDTKSTFVLLKGDAGNLNNWEEYKNPDYKISTYPSGSSAFASKESANNAIHFEFKLEMAMEGKRFFDLTRWGEAEKKLNDIYQFEGNLGFMDFGNGSFTAPKNNYFPIPQPQIDLSEVNGEQTLKQNEGY